MPYPFWAPAQSALGILSMKAQNRWKEHRSFLVAYNTLNTVYNGVVGTVNTALQARYEEAKRLDATSKIAAVAGNMVGAVSNLAQGKDFKKVSFTSIAQRPKPFGLASRSIIPNRPKDSTRNSYVIGGGKESAPLTLSRMLQSLTMFARGVQNDLVEKKETVSLAEKLGRIRVCVVRYGDPNLLALFEALFTATVTPATLAMIDQVESQVDDKTGAERTIRTNWKATRCDDNVEQAANPTEVARPETESPPDNTTRPAATNEGGYDVVPMDGQETDDEDDDYELMAKLLMQANIGTLPEEDEQRASEINVEPVPRFDASKVDRQYLDQEQERLVLNIADNFTKEVKRVVNGEAYVFTYDRMALENLGRSTVRLMYRIEVTDFDSNIPPFVVQIESGQDNGIVAHAVYAGLALDVEALDVAAEEMADTLYEVHATGDATMLSDVQNRLARAARFFSSNPFLKSKGGERLEDMFFKNASDVFNAGKRYAKSRMKDAAVTDLEFDPCGFEQRLCEIRIMSRMILPLLRENDPKTSIEAQEILAEIGIPAASSEQSASGAGDSGESSELDEPILRENAYNELMRQAEEEATYRGNLLQLLPETVTLFDDRADDRGIAKRRLPQIVNPRSTHSRFVVYDNMDPPPDEEFEFDEDTMKFSKFSESTKLVPKRNWADYLPGRREIRRSAGLLTGLLALNLATTAASLLTRQAAARASVEFLILNLRNILTGGASGTAAVITGVLSMAGGVSLWTRLVRFASSLSNGAPLAWNAGQTIMEFSKQRFARSKNGGQTLQLHLRTTQGVPVLSAVAAANRALAVEAKRINDWRVQLGILDNLTVIYNRHAVRRFLFQELYEADLEVRDTITRLLESSRVPDWDAVPDANPLRLTPPQDVVDALFEAEHLRGLKVSKYIAFTCGNSNELNATSPMQIAAMSAHMELFDVLLQERNSIRGFHLMQTIAEASLALAENGARIIQAAYGSSANATMVGGNDIVWTCMPSGVATRLALRHLSVFVDSPVDSGVAGNINYWHRPRRLMVDQFASSWIAEAKKLASDQTSVPRDPVPVSVRSTESLRRFARVSALVSSGSLTYCAARAALAGAVHAVRSVLETSVKARDLLDAEKPHADMFEDQTELAPPPSQMADDDARSMFWAGRRVVPAQRRNAAVGSGVEDLVTTMSALNFTDKADRVYYCPMGGRLGELPPKTTFGIDELQGRVVWMALLEEMAQLLQGSITPAFNTEQSHVLVHCTGFQSKSGFSRHPLAISYDAEQIVHVSLADIQRRVCAEDTEVQNQDVSDLWTSVNEQYADSGDVQSALKRMRALAFNADRLLFAHYLAESLVVGPMHVHVSLPSADCALSMALALAVRAVDRKLSSVPISVQVGGGEAEYLRARVLLSSLYTQAQTVIKRGCKACLLAEIALCI
jgi:hypothetical protein